MAWVPYRLRSQYLPGNPLKNTMNEWLMWQCRCSTITTLSAKASAPSSAVFAGPVHDRQAHPDRQLQSDNTERRSYTPELTASNGRPRCCPREKQKEEKTEGSSSKVRSNNHSAFFLESALSFPAELSKCPNYWDRNHQQNRSSTPPPQRMARIRLPLVMSLVALAPTASLAFVTTATPAVFPDRIQLALGDSNTRHVPLRTR